MKRIALTLLVGLLAALATAPLFGQQPTPAPCPTCVAQDSQDDVDFYAAVVAGIGDRPHLGQYREVALSVRLLVSDAKSGKSDALKNFQDRMEAGIKPNPQRACRIATAAVIGLEMANAFGANIPQSVINEAIALQKQVCATVIGLTVTLNATPALAPPTVIDVPQVHTTGLKLPPLNVRAAMHLKEAMRNQAFHAKHGTIALPASIDYRSTLTTAIEDQGQCGSCHDFSGVGIVTAANIKAGNLTTVQPLSEQYILDLNPNGDGGCNGGDANTIFSWCQQGNGIPLTSIYGPYAAYSRGSNQLSTTATGYTLSDWGYADTVTGVASVQAVKEALVTYGPISVCIGCPGPFMNYGGGIITYDLSSGIDHQIILVGYIDDASVAGGGYWIIRNSWGSGWGEKGYFRAAYSTNPTTEAMYGVAKAGQTTVIQPGSGPTPGPQPTPSRRASILGERGTRLWSSGRAEDQERVLKAIKAAEDALQNAN